jgi:hypothetical protein
MLTVAAQPDRALSFVGWFELPLLLLGVIGTLGLLLYFWSDFKFKLLVRSDQDRQLSTGENLAVLKSWALVMSCGFSFLVMSLGLLSVAYDQVNYLRSPHSISADH